MDSLSKAVKIDTSKGQVEVTVEGFAIRPEDTVALQQFGEAGDDQECGYLLLIVKNISHPVSDDYSGHIRFDEIGTISDEEGVQRTSSDSSLKYRDMSAVAARHSAYTRDPTYKSVRRNV